MCGRRYRGRPVGVWRFIKLSKDPNLYESLLEDAAALVGVAFAAIGVAASTYFHVLWADGAASVAIGLLLIADSLVIAESTRSLVSGESVTPSVLAEIRRLLKENAELPVVSEIRTLHLGPRTILVALTIASERPAKGPDLAYCLKDMEARVRAADKRVRFVYFGFGRGCRRIKEAARPGRRGEAASSCPKCGHTPLPKDQRLPAQCPACGVILVKVVRQDGAGWSAVSAAIGRPATARAPPRRGVSCGRNRGRSRCAGVGCLGAEDAMDAARRRRPSLALTTRA